MAEKAPSKPVLLSGGNPQIPKGEGNAPVHAYIAAMPGWKSDVGVGWISSSNNRFQTSTRRSNGIRLSMGLKDKVGF